MKRSLTPAVKNPLPSPHPSLHPGLLKSKFLLFGG